MPTNLLSKAHMRLTVWKRTSLSQYQCVFTEARSQGQGKYQVKVKVNKFCVGREELINAYKPTKQGTHVINGVKENKLKSISVCVHWSAKSRSRSINFVLVGRNSSMPTNVQSKAHMWLMVWKRISLRYCIPQVSNANNFSYRAFTMFPCPFL